jgi:hypothetical protein
MDLSQLQVSFVARLRQQLDCERRSTIGSGPSRKEKRLMSQMVDVRKQWRSKDHGFSGSLRVTVTQNSSRPKLTTVQGQIKLLLYMMSRLGELLHKRRSWREVCNGFLCTTVLCAG